MYTAHLLTKPFASRAAALRYSEKMLPSARLAAYGLTDACRVLPVAGGFAALFDPRADGVRSGDVFHGAKGAATRRQISDAGSDE